MSDSVLIALITAVASVASSAFAAWAVKTTRDVRTAVMKNGGVSDPPTLPDRMHKLGEQQHELSTQQALTHQLLQQHLKDASDEDHRRSQAERDLWSAINNLRRP